MKRTVLFNSHASALETRSVLKPKRGKMTKALAATLVLTSLVDAFSILVIYLMVNTTSGMNMDVANGIELPTAAHTQTIDTGLLVQVNPAGILINDQIIEIGQLAEYLKQTQAQLQETEDPRAKKLILQADKEADFTDVNPIILAGTQSGFETIVFAVIQQGETE